VGNSHLQKKIEHYIKITRSSLVREAARRSMSFKILLVTQGHSKLHC